LEAQLKAAESREGGMNLKDMAELDAYRARGLDSDVEGGALTPIL